MSLADVLQWSGEHATAVMVVCLVVGLGGLSCIALYKVALALAQLRAWWQGGTWLGGRSPSLGGHPGGDGGRSSEYESVMQSAGWRRRRSQAIRRAHHRCQECGARGPLDVHHLTYRNLGQERPYELAVLCRAHHAQLHSHQRRLSA